MRLPLGLLLALIFLGTAFAGCLGERSGGDDDEDPDDGGTPPADGALPSEPGTEEPEREPSDVAPPSEQRVADPSELEKPGQYAILPRASDAKDREWSVPDWTTGDTWIWENSSPFTPGDTTRDELEVIGSDEAWEIGVYEVEKIHTDKDGDAREPEAAHYTHASLVELHDDGYIEHVHLFPLEDGKRWVYAVPAAGGGITKVTAEARHVPDHMWKTERIEAWSIRAEYEGDSNLEVRQWVGVDQKNLVHREFWADLEGVPTNIVSTTLETYDAG